MKLLYDCAFARQMLLTRQINVEARYTGLLPKVVLSGTLIPTSAQHSNRN